MKIKTMVILILCSLLASLVCTTDMSGGSTESTNQRIANTVYEPDGVTQAKGAVVVIRSQNTLATIAGVTPEQGEIISDTAISDEYGRYTFDNTLSDGLYSFEATKDGNAVFVNPVNVAGGDSTLEIDPVTLKPAGKITGALHLAEGGDPTEVYVLALGIDRFARVNADDTFTFGGLGEGNYYLKIITTLDNYGGFDTAWVKVTPAATTDIGTITLPFSGIPVPQNVKVTYEPYGQKATISWDKVERPTVRYYNIYRGFEDLGTPINVNARLNGYRVADTVFIDSTIGDLCITGLSAAVAYSVAVVDSAENEGKKSLAIKVGAPPSITMGNDIGLRSWTTGRIRDFAIARNGDIYVACDDTPFVFMLDSALNYKKTFRLKSPLSTETTVFPTGVCSNKTLELLYIARSDNAGIFIYNSKGESIDTIIDPTVQVFGVTDCEVINNSLHVLTGSDSVISFDGDGNRKKTWHVVNGRCLADGGAARVVVGAYKQICWYDSAGNLLSNIPVAGSPLAIAVDTTKLHLYVLAEGGISFTFQEYDSTHIKISQYVHPLLGGGNSKHTMRLQEGARPLVLHSDRLIQLRISDKQ